MHISTLFTIASLLLIGSYSLPQPENLKATTTIEEREARIDSGGPFPSHNGDPESWTHHEHGAGSPATNGTKIKEREAHHERPTSIPSGLGENFEHHRDGSDGGSGTPSTNDTKIKERQDKFTPPDGMTWKEFMRHMRHRGGSPSKSASVPLSTSAALVDSSELSSTSTNSTKVKMMKFRD